MSTAIYRHLDPAEATDRIGEFRAVYAAVFAEPPYNEGPEMADRFVGWVRDEASEPGFDFVEAVVDGRVVGFAYGHRRPAGKWWRGADRAMPDEVRAGPTFAVMEWAVLPSERGAGVGVRLMTELLAARVEPYATLTVNPAAPARAIYERLGWQHVASTKAGAVPAMDVMIFWLAHAEPDHRPNG